MPRLAFLVLPVTGIFFSSCITQELGGVATASSLLVALPLLPAAEAYHAISGDIEKDRVQGEQLAEGLRPVYKERIKLLSNRDATKDADQIARQGLVFIMPMDFPSKHSFNMYPGMPASWIESLPRDHDEKTMELIKGDEKALYLMTISSDDPRHGVSVIYAFNQDSVYSEFFRKRHTYKELFNRQMAKKSKNEQEAMADNRP